MAIGEGRARVCRQGARRRARGGRDELVLPRRHEPRRNRFGALDRFRAGRFRRLREWCAGGKGLPQAGIHAREENALCLQLRRDAASGSRERGGQWFRRGGFGGVVARQDRELLRQEERFPRRTGARLRGRFARDDRHARGGMGGRRGRRGAARGDFRRRGV